MKGSNPPQSNADSGLISEKTNKNKTNNNAGANKTTIKWNTGTNEFFVFDCETYLVINFLLKNTVSTQVTTKNKTSKNINTNKFLRTIA